MFRHVLEPYVPHIHHQSCTFPQYGYLPGRSTIHALRRVFEHCAKVREACRGQGHSVLKRFHGQEPSPLTGGVQVTVDLASAFDSIPRQQLLRGMQEIGLPDRVVEVVMEWHCGARYCVEHDGKPRLIKVTQGVRQGCVISHLLWLVYSHLISTELASLIGEAATKSLLNIYADDYHASLTFNSIHGLEVGLSHIGTLFTVLGRLAMTISHSKSKATLTCRGKGAESLKRRFIRHTKSGRVLRFHYAQEAIDILLVDNFVYLGAVVSYGSFEDQTLEHRLQIGRANFWRLHKILRSRHSLNRGNRLRIWRACVHTASVYGLTACGLTCKGARKLTQETLKQIRLVVGDHVYMTCHSHDEVLDKWSIPHPILDLQKLMDDEPVQDDWTDCFTRNRYSPWWMAVRETLIIPDDGKLSQIPPNTTGVACPTCGVYFLDMSSMIVHMAKHHKDDPHRPRNQTITFDKARDAKDGLHICRHCHKTLCDWSSLRKHIQEKRCPVLFAVPVREAGDAQPSLGAPVAPSEAHVESDTLQIVPYAQRPHVLSAVRRHGDNAAFHLPDRHVLTHHCALCNQWSTVRGKMKQHYRLSHSATHEESRG